MQARINTRLLKTIEAKSKPYEIVDDQLKGFLLRIQPSGVMTYYLSYYNAHGKRKRYKIARYDSITPMQARDIALELSAQIACGDDINASKLKKTQMMTLSNFLKEAYAPWVLIERKSGKETLAMIECHFKHLFSQPLEEIKPWVIEKWRTQALKNGNLASTINRNVTALKAALSKAVEWELIENHPLTNLKMLKVDTQEKTRYLSKTEEKNLRLALKQRDKNLRKARKSGNQWRIKRGYALFPKLDQVYFSDHLEPMVLLSINTGLRRGELFSLTWENVNFDKKSLTIQGSKAKSGKTRHIPLNSEALEILQHWQISRQSNKNQLVFSNPVGKKFNNVNKSWATLLKMANIENFRWHDMRHHFASKLVMAQIDLNTVRELLGHASLTMTLRYAHLAPEHKIKAVEKIINYD